MAEPVITDSTMFEADTLKIGKKNYYLVKDSVEKLVEMLEGWIPVDTNNYLVVKREAAATAIDELQFLFIEPFNELKYDLPAVLTKDNVRELFVMIDKYIWVKRSDIFFISKRDLSDLGWEMQNYIRDLINI